MFGAYDIPEGGMTPEQIERRQKIAAAMMSRTGAPRNVGEGLDAASRSILGALMMRRAEKMGAEQQASQAVEDSFGGMPPADGDALFADILGGGGGGSAGSVVGSSGPLVFEPEDMPGQTSNPADALAMGGGPTSAAAASYISPGEASAAMQAGAERTGIMGPTRAAEQELRRRPRPQRLPTFGFGG